MAVWVKVAKGSDSIPKGESYRGLVGWGADLKSDGYDTKITTRVEKETWSRTFHHTLWRTETRTRKPRP